MKKIILMLFLVQIASCADPTNNNSGNSTGTSVISNARVFYSSLGKEGYDIFKAETKNNSSVKINKSINDTLNFDISKDGAKVLYVSTNNELHICDTDGNNLQVILKDSNIKRFPRFSPDGNKILYTGENGNKQNDIYIINSDGTNNKKLTDNTPGDNIPIWSPDGKKIAFVTQRDGNIEIYTMNSDGTEPKNITKSPNLDYSPCWSPDSSKIVFTSLENGNWKIYIINSDGSNLKKLSDGHVDISPSWSPDNKYIAYISKQDGKDDGIINMVQLYDLENKKLITIDQGDDYNYPVWSSDSINLFYKSLNKDGYQMTMYNLSSEKVIKVAPSPKDILSTISR